MAIRFSSAILFGLVITLALFYLMQGLIAGGRSAMTPATTGRLVNFVRIKQTLQVPPPRRIPTRPPPTVQPPKTVKPIFSRANVGPGRYSMQPPDKPVQGDPNRTMFSSDGEYLPIVKVQPIYPQRALSRGMSGWVVVQFTVTSRGTVRNPVVVQHCAWIKGPRTRGECHDSPNTIFDRAAVQAARKFKYKPRVIDGQAMDTAGVENRITFELVGGG